MRKQIVGAVAGLAVAGAALVGGAAQAAPGKIVVCHVTASGATLQLSVSANAIREGHANHPGDTFMEAGTCGDVPPPPPPPDSSSTSTTTRVTFPQ